MTADVSVLVCRGCCCGTTKKHPDVDHGGQLQRVTTALEGKSAARVMITDCLGPCERSNVVVVRAGSVRRWFGDLLADSDTDALVRWVAGGAGDSIPARLAARQFDPAVAHSVLAQPVALSSEALVDLVESALREGLGRWFLGVEGAGAEFNTFGAASVTTRHGSTIESVTTDGGLRLNVGPAVAAFTVAVPDTEAIIALFLAVSRASLAVPARRFTARGPDAGALRASDRESVLFDLAIDFPAASFCLRTADPDLQQRLAGQAGRAWADVLDAVGPTLVEHSPDRVIETAVGRAEVYGPSAAAGGPAGPGPHSHLSPAELELGNELPTLFALPTGWAPAAIFHPPPGWTLP